MADKILTYVFNERERRLIKNACRYAWNDPAGLPTHDLLLIISKYHQLVGAVLPRFTEQGIWDALRGTGLVCPPPEIPSQTEEEF